MESSNDYDDKARRDANAIAILKAGLIGPLAVIPAALIFMCASSVFSQHALPLNEVMMGSTFVGLFALAPAYALTVFYGLPVFLLLRKIGADGYVAVSFIALAPCLIALREGDGYFFALYAWFALAVAWSCRYLAYRDPPQLNSGTTAS